MINLETWTSDKGKQELHHFLAADPQTYVYGVNAQLIGPQACELIRNIVTGRLLELQEGGFRVHGHEQPQHKYTASWDDEHGGWTTQADTLGDLHANIDEAFRLHGGVASQG